MSAPTTDGISGITGYAHLWQDSPHAPRWVLWDTAGEVLVFDRDVNCPVHIDDEAIRDEVLRRMRAAGVPESPEYPGRPCGR
ncbi:hypothetical protein OHT57_41545 [Streptomyces sp. NBC_00285]|uniref:hypothetical protein n=1 Tax=Streptomyces sp. NBC_00285 TaxID=2975700 RepID=UPI002E2AAD15|nr:hypothetical protein [Streptomyces sp. NBC_00285]